MTVFQFSPLEKALDQLDQAVSHPPASELERDGTIQRFEYCFELCWKAMRSLLLKAGRPEVSGSPRPLFREAMQDGLIDDFKLWDSFLEARDESTHTYHLKTAQEVYEAACRFPPHAHALLARMKAFAARIDLGP